MMQNYVEYSGSEFNKLTQGEVFYKLTNPMEKHHGFQYKDGLNIDVKPFDVTRRCKNGLSFTDDENLLLWISQFQRRVTPNPFIRRVLIPNDARVSCEGNKYKADRFILSARKKLSEDEAIRIRLLLLQPSFLRRVKKQTETDRLTAMSLGFDISRYIIYNPETDNLHSVRLLGGKIQAI
jgi:hypothetical protein